MKWIMYASIMLSVLPAMAQNHHGGGRPRMQLSDEQKQCLSGILGEPGQGERPTHKAMQNALHQCGILKSDNSKQENDSDRPVGPPPNLTEEQLSCLESKLGKFGEGERPSDEAFKQAHADCGVEMPQQRSSQNQ